MIAGNPKFRIILAIVLLFFFNISIAEEQKISVNIDELPATFEEEVDEADGYDDSLEKEDLEKKSTSSNKNGEVMVVLKALDKITAKTSIIKMGIEKEEVFGELEIKVLKCVLSSKEDPPDTIAYLQIKDLAEKNKDQVFIFNGWTFASTPTLKSVDHPIYDVWLVGCENV
tara:strand:+ start:2004 stop:2516 length:513 start_codon:yes stop_codon:yes gene_type:complete